MRPDLDQEPPRRQLEPGAGRARASACSPARAGRTPQKARPIFTDIDRTLQIWASLSGKLWERPDYRVGITGITTTFLGVHQAFFINAGGIGILVGDGWGFCQSGIQKVFETYYSYSASKIDEITL